MKGWLGFADMIASNVLLVLGRLMLALYVGWLMRDPVDELRKLLVWPIAYSWHGLLRYVATPVLLVLLLRNLYSVVSKLLD